MVRMPFHRSPMDAAVEERRGLRAVVALVALLCLGSGVPPTAVPVAEAAKQLATYYLNRSAAYSSWGRFEDSIADCQSALKIDHTNGKAYKRMARAHCELGDYNRGRALCEEGASASGGEPSVVAELSNVRQLCEWHDEGDAAMALGNYSLARTFFANMLSKTSAPHTVPSAAGLTASSAFFSGLGSGAAKNMVCDPPATLLSSARDWPTMRSRGFSR